MPNYWNFCEGGAVEQAGLQYCTVVSVYQNKPIFAAYLCAVLSLTLKKVGLKCLSVLRHFTKGEMAHSPESLSFVWCVPFR